MNRHEDTSRNGYLRMFPSCTDEFSKDALNALSKCSFDFAGDTPIPAGYTYLGQFITHDISRLQRGESKPEAGPVAVGELINLNTPALDLDSLYGNANGFGDKIPTVGNLYFDGYPWNANDNSQAFDPKNFALLRDLPRYEKKENENYKGEAKIGDPRNDENYLVAQVHLLFMNLHNCLMHIVQNEQLARNGNAADDLLGEVRREVRQLYHHVIINDFLRRLLAEKVYKEIFEPGSGPTKLLLNKLDGGLPVEFSVAAFRVGHTMVKDRYRLNGNDKGNGQKMVTLEQLFKLTGRGEEWQSIRTETKFQIDWETLFDMKKNGMGGGEYWDHAESIDTKLANALLNLANAQAGQGGHNLVLRNLLRGNSVSLPSAQSIIHFLWEDCRDYARSMGIDQHYLNTLETLGQSLDNVNPLKNPGYLKKSIVKQVIRRIEQEGKSDNRQLEDFERQLVRAIRTTHVKEFSKKAIKQISGAPEGGVDPVAAGNNASDKLEKSLVQMIRSGKFGEQNTGVPIRSRHSPAPGRRTANNFGRSRGSTRLERTLNQYLKSKILVMLAENKESREEVEKYKLHEFTPLWTFILVEDGIPGLGSERAGSLGKLGSIIVGETFRALLKTTLFEKNPGGNGSGASESSSLFVNKFNQYCAKKPEGPAQLNGLNDLTMPHLIKFVNDYAEAVKNNNPT